MAVLMQQVDGVVVQKFILGTQSVVTIGRSAKNDIVIDDNAVSGAHAEIHAMPNPDFPEFIEYYLVDLESTNGTEVNGMAVSKRQKLEHNDGVKIAWNEFKFIDEGQENLEKTSHMIKGS